jgi:hypothetical protein
MLISLVGRCRVATSHSVELGTNTSVSMSQLATLLYTTVKSGARIIYSLSVIIKAEVLLDGRRQATAVACKRHAHRTRVGYIRSYIFRDKISADGLSDVQMHRIIRCAGLIPADCAPRGRAEIGTWI